MEIAQINKIKILFRQLRKFPQKINSVFLLMHCYPHDRHLTFQTLSEKEKLCSTINHGKFETIMEIEEILEIQTYF